MRMVLGTAGAVLVLAAILSSVMAGETGKKCQYSTQECLNHMAEKMKASGWIGIEYDKDTKTGMPTILRVIPGSPAEKAGLQVDDVLLSVDGIEINEKNYEALGRARKEWKPGRTVTYTIRRGGSTSQVPIILGEWPANLLARYIGEHMLEHADADATAPRRVPPK